jgi:hypothetical protein
MAVRRRHQEPKTAELPKGALGGFAFPGQTQPATIRIEVPMRDSRTHWVLLFTAALAGGCAEQPVEPVSAPSSAPEVKRKAPDIDARAKARYFGAHQDLAQRIRRAHTTAGTAAARRPARARNLRLVAHVPLDGLNADVWAHKGFAYVGTWIVGGPPDFIFCPAHGVRIVDVSNRTNPTFVGSVAAIPGTSQEDVVVARINTAFFHGDLLVTGIQSCFGEAPGGIDIWDVTNPRAPEHLGFWPVSSVPPVEGGAGGVHELHLFQRGNRAYVTAAVPFSEFLPAGGGGDFRLVDVTDPRNPVQVGDWGAVEDGGLIPGQGQDFFGHSASADKTGTTAIVSYWDAGAILLDISDPANPTFIGRTIYPAGSDGDTHSIWLARGGNLLLTADEDFNPTNGTWGFLRLWNVKNPAAPVEIGRFGTANALAPNLDCCFSIHNPLVRGSTAYLSWYADGIRVVDISQPAAPREIASFVPDYEFPFVWGVYVDRDLIFASDFDTGLYVLKHVR